MKPLSLGRKCDLRSKGGSHQSEHLTIEADSAISPTRLTKAFVTMWLVLTLIAVSCGVS